MAYLVIVLGFALAGGVVGRYKGSSFWLWFLISGVLPFLGLLVAVVYRNERAELRRQCPRCGRVLMLYDTLCTSCGQELYLHTARGALATPAAEAPRPEGSGGAAPAGSPAP